MATPALAELGVGEGGLPDGAKQFSNLLKVQKDWIALSQTIKKKRADVSDEEWKNVALFLRKVYQVWWTSGLYVVQCIVSLFAQVRGSLNVTHACCLFAR